MHWAEAVEKSPRNKAKRSEEDCEWRILDPDGVVSQFNLSNFGHPQFEKSYRTPLAGIYDYIATEDGIVLKRRDKLVELEEIEKYEDWEPLT